MKNLKFIKSLLEQEMELDERLEKEAQTWGFESWDEFKNAEPEKAHKMYFEVIYGDDPLLRFY